MMCGVFWITENGHEIWNMLASELAKYKLDLVRVQGIICNKGGCELADNYALFYGNGVVSDYLRMGLFIHK